MTKPQPQPQPPTYGLNISCIFPDCLFCNTTFEPLFLPPPSPPPPPPPPPSQTHIAPFLIATVSILGISFLLLSTCTIILRLRFTRRRSRTSPASHDGVDDGGDMAVDHPIWHINTVGLQQSVIDSITAFKYKRKDGFFIDGINNDCSVCLTEFEDGVDLRLLPKCSHAFHLDCIDTWLRSHKTCPLCRAPIVSEVEGGVGGGGRFDSSGSSSGEVRIRMNLEESDELEGGGSSNQGVDVLGGLRLPVFEGVKIGEILRKNRELRIFSDLGENYRFRGFEEGLDPVRRSVSFSGVRGGGLIGSEGCSSNGSLNEGKKVDLRKGNNKRGSSMSGLSIKGSSNCHSLQKGPVSMKRSLSSSSKFFSFRRTRSQASILPL